jgi:hypothetical protein
MAATRKRPRKPVTAERKTMKKYIIKWNCGYGDNYDEIEAENEKEANMAAYEAWREDAENNADYDVIGEATDELRQDYL